MANNKPTQIVISGVMLTDKYNASAGDIYIYRNDDREGALARGGGHTNYGYSGYYLASIFDGNDWRKLQFNKLVSYENRSYEQARQCNIVENYLRTIVLSWRGSTAVYDSSTRSFRIIGREIPEL